MTEKRFDALIEAAGGLIYVAPRSLGGLSPREFSRVWMGQGRETVADLIRRGAMMPMSLCEDSGYLIRFVLGALTQQETEEWTARVRWKLKVPCGQVLVSGVLSGDLDFEADEFPNMGPAFGNDTHDIGFFVDVPPGDYAVEVYNYPPNDLSSGWWRICEPHLFEKVSETEAESVQDYFRRTRPGDQLPKWIEKDHEDDGGYVVFIVRLAPLVGDVLMPKLESDEMVIEWEFRKPEKCPLGIRSEFGKYAKSDSVLV